MLSKVLIALTGQKWKDMRSTLSPAFTSSKMRQMFELVNDCSDEMTNFFEKITTPADLVLDMKNTFSKLTNDVIATCAFGIKVNSFKNPENEFFLQGKRVLNPSKWRLLLVAMAFQISPKLIRWLGLNGEAKKLERFFRTMIMDTIAVREREHIIRPDMIHLLMQLRQGTLRHDDDQHETNNEGYASLTESKLLSSPKTEWSDDELVAQCVQFFLAGFETSSLLLSFAANAIATHPEIQEKLVAEIDAVYERSNGNLNFNDLPSLRYMDMVISEVLRKWPPVPITDRVCVKDYNYHDDAGQQFVIEKGASVWLPILPFHYDPKFFPNPNQFDPERFSEVNVNKIAPASYIPFGAGPRSCIGIIIVGYIDFRNSKLIYSYFFYIYAYSASRFALMQVKSVLYHLLKKFTFEICDKTVVPMKMGRFFMLPEKGIHLQLKRRL